MAKEILSHRCYERDVKNVGKALAWVHESAVAEQAIDGEESAIIVRQAFARCRGPKLPGRSDDDTTGVCQLVFEPTVIAGSDADIPIPVTLPVPPDIDRHIEIHYR